MDQKFAEIFPDVSQQLVQAGSQIEKEHLKCFHLAKALLKALQKRVLEWLDFLEGMILDIAVPDRNPFQVVARVDPTYSFMPGVFTELMKEAVRAEEIPADYLTDTEKRADRINCINRFLNEGIALYRAARVTAQT